MVFKLRMLHILHVLSSLYDYDFYYFIVASEHNYSLQVPVVAVPVGATQKHTPSVPMFPQAV